MDQGVCILATSTCKFPNYITNTIQRTYQSLVMVLVFFNNCNKKLMLPQGLLNLEGFF